MKSYETWHDIRLDYPESEEKPYTSLRPGDADVHQFKEGKHDHLAVHDTAPYGDLTNTQVKGLLPPVQKGSDYTVFEVPHTLMALKALSLGTGNRHPELLHETYEKVGAMVGRILSRGVHAPDLSIDDFGVNRRTGAVYVLPPVHFTADNEAPKQDVGGLLASLANLGSVFEPEDIAQLQSDIEVGAQA